MVVDRGGGVQPKSAVVVLVVVVGEELRAERAGVGEAAEPAGEGWGVLEGLELRLAVGVVVARALEADTRAWIAAWNDDPKPYVWTKTADQILASLKAYCLRISDSGH